MTSLTRRMLGGCALLAYAATTVAAQDPQRPRSGWPCNGTVDPSSIRAAEATGGKVFLVQPGETGAAAFDMTARTQHRETVLRASGNVDDGTYDFQIPIDSAIESAYFFLSMQCVHFVTIVQPSGDELRVERPEVTYRAFEALRMATIRAPMPGTWTVRMAGRGVFSVIVSARSELKFGSVSYVYGNAPVKGIPPLGKTLQMAATVEGAAREIAFQFLSAASVPVATIDLHLERDGEGARKYSGDVTLPTRECRVAITGTDERGFPFQRVDDRLMIVTR
jgi:hypothetical protein